MTDEDAEVLKEAAAVAALTGEDQAEAEQYVRVYGEEGAKAKLISERLMKIQHEYPAAPPIGERTPVPSERPFVNDRHNSNAWCAHVEEQVVDKLDGIYGKPVYNQEEVIAKTADGTCYRGYVDLLFDNKHVVDLKSDTMSEWSSTTAASKGRKFAEQVQAYLDGPTLAGRGGIAYLFMIGHPTEKTDVKAIFEAAVERVSDKIEIVYVEGGATPEIITRTLYDTFFAK